MALPNPALTFQMPAALVNCATTGKADVLTAIETAINALVGADSNWTAATIDGDAADTPAILISAPATSPISNFRAILGFVDTAGTLPLTAQYRAPDIQGEPGVGLLSIGPDGRTGANNWYDPNPYGGGGERSSGFWKIVDNDKITKVGVIASAETLTLLFRQANDSLWSVCSFGALFDPPDLASAEADERVYGMMVMGSNAGSAINSGLLQTLNGQDTPWWHDGSNGNVHMGCFDGAAPANWIVCASNYVFANKTSAATRATTRGGGVFFTPVYAYSGVTDFDGFIGRIRGLFTYEDALLRQVIQDNVPADRGYAIAYSLGISGDSLVHGNE